MILPISLTTAAAAAVVNLWLALRAAKVRMSAKVMQGDGGDTTLLERMRAHANFTEYTPFVLILIALIEFARGTSPILWGLAIVYLLARVAHGIGMTRPAPNPFRAGGIILTWAILLGLAGWAAAIPYATPTGAVETVRAG